MSNQERVTQAVILAGGQGTRLRPFTDTAPKPLYPVHGKPFIAYLLTHLASQGIRDVIMLVGYRGDQLEAAIGDGSTFGLCIRYVYSPVEALTGQRLRDALPWCDDHLLLAYCDNYWPMQLDRMWERYQSSGAEAQLVVYANTDGYTRNNVTVDEGRIVTYDPTRTAEGLAGVDIGFALMHRRVIERLPDENVSFERTIYPQLVQEGALGTYETHHRYYSIGSYERLALTESFLEPQRMVLIDRDGTLNERPPQAQYVTSWADFTWLPGSREALQRLKEAGYRLALITNQPGIARGALTMEALDALHRAMQKELEAHSAAFDAIYTCQHNWNEGCFCRKPQPGMLFAAQRDFHLDLSQTTFVGDDERDVAAGEAAGCQTALITVDQSLSAWVDGFLAQEIAQV